MKPKSVCESLISNVKNKKISAPFFLLISSPFLIISLVIYVYLNNYVYVVMIDDHEVGVVQDVEDVEVFVDNLTERCGELFGMHIKPGKKIDLVKEFRPDSDAQPENVQQAIRTSLSLLTEAKILKINGEPVLALTEDSDLDKLKSSIAASYSRSQGNVVTIDSVVTDDLSLEPARVEPTVVNTMDEAVSFLVKSNRGKGSQTASFIGTVNRSFLDSRYPTSLSGSSSSNGLPNGKVDSTFLSAEPVTVNVRTLEELTTQESIPFSTEIEYDEEAWIVQQDVIEPGKDGVKEITYHVTRENGIEVERTKVEEKVFKEPATQVEVHGTAQVPDIGSGRFIWPVEDGGAVTPGRGFSEWHTGIDIAGDLGTNILAADSGIVWFSGRGGSQGNYIIIYHGSYWSLYLHNEVNLVDKGDQVEQGDIIGRLGSTGRSTGPHLHFEIRLDDGTGEWMGYYQHKPIDPLRYFNP
ncbi:MAG: M23 family metallopeptidase [Bacillota bacterium]